MNKMNLYWDIFEQAANLLCTLEMYVVKVLVDNFTFRVMAEKKTYIHSASAFLFKYLRFSFQTAQKKAETHRLRNLKISQRQSVIGENT